MNTKPPLMRQIVLDEQTKIYEFNSELCSVLKYLKKQAHLDETRPILQTLFIEGHKIVATDGFKIVIAEFDIPDNMWEFKDGMWNVEFIPKDRAIFHEFIGGKYVEYEKIFNYKNIEQAIKQKIKPKSEEIYTYLSTTLDPQLLRSILSASFLNRKAFEFLIGKGPVVARTEVSFNEFNVKFNYMIMPMMSWSYQDKPGYCNGIYIHNEKVKEENANNTSANPK